MRTVSPPQPGNFTGDTNTNHQIHFNVDCNQDESFQFLTPPLFYRTVSGESHHSPQLADTTTESTQPMHQTQTRTSVEEPSYPTYSHMLREDVDDFCFSPLKQNKEDFEPLPVMDDDNAPCDDFASFIEGAIKLIGE
eukprot:scaffold8613_cov94-Skeletonema_dohrnii-CCMP3373.AAC.1